MFCRIYREVEILLVLYIICVNFSRKVLFCFCCFGFVFMYFIIIKNIGIIISFCLNIRLYLCYLVLMLIICILYVNL